MADNNEELQPIIIKKIVKGGGHHGGAWKVAYADFVTAMMAFFLLLWLLSVASEEQKNAISNYFDPTSPKVSESSSGAGGVMGGLTMSPQGAMVSDVQPINSTTPKGSAVNNSSAKKTADGNEMREKSQDGKAGLQSLEQAKEMMRKEEEKKFDETKKLIEQAIQDDPDLKKLAENMVIDMTPEGLRIQLVDSKGRPMFASGSARMLPIAKQLISKVTGIINTLPNELSIKGHTDSTPYGAGASYTNWELSADRANAARRELIDVGIPADRVNNVAGKADTDHLLPDDPKNQRNRRISVVLLKQELTNPKAFDARAEKLAEETTQTQQQAAPIRSAPVQVPVGTFRRTPGAVEFP